LEILRRNLNFSPELLRQDFDQDFAQLDPRNLPENPGSAELSVFRDVRVQQMREEEHLHKVRPERVLEDEKHREERCLGIAEDHRRQKDQCQRILDEHPEEVHQPQRLPEEQLF